MKNTKLLASIMTIIMIAGCSSATNISPQTEPIRTVMVYEPLDQPIYADALYTTYDDVQPLGKGNEYHDFIIKGKVDSIEEVEVSWKIGEKIHIEWLAVCNITIVNILYGDIPGIKDKIKVVSGQTTRRTAKEEFMFSVGNEYYIIAHIFNDKDKTRYLKDKYDQLQEYSLGDVYLYDNRHCLFPIENGMVLFQGWPFTGSEKPTITEENYGTLASVTSKINEDEFLIQFKQMIKDAKNLLSKATAIPETINTPDTTNTLEETNTPD